MYAFQPIAFNNGDTCTSAPDFNGFDDARISAAGATINLDYSTYNIGCPATSWSAINLPTGLSINASTGVITGTIGSGFFDPTVTATNAYGYDTSYFNWSVF